MRRACRAGTCFRPRGALRFFPRGTAPTVLLVLALLTTTVSLAIVGSGAQAQGVCRGLAVTVDLGLGQLPTPGDDVVLGTSGDDLIAADDGDDVVCGGGGDDTIWGQGGDDVLFGEGGADKLRGGDGSDWLSGGLGADDVNGGRGDDNVFGDADDDRFVRGGTGDDYVDGGSGDDELVAGNGGSDRVTGGSGNDVLVTGGPRPDTVDGGGGDDNVKGNKGADILFGGPGDDDLRGGPQPDDINGGSGFDICNGGAELAIAGLCESEANMAGSTGFSVEAVPAIPVPVLDLGTPIGPPGNNSVSIGIAETWGDRLPAGSPPAGWTQTQARNDQTETSVRVELHSALSLRVAATTVVGLEVEATGSAEGTPGDPSVSVTVTSAGTAQQVAQALATGSETFLIADGCLVETGLDPLPAPAGFGDVLASDPIQVGDNIGQYVMYASCNDGLINPDGTLNPAWSAVHVAWFEPGFGLVQVVVVAPTRSDLATADRVLQSIAFGS